MTIVAGLADPVSNTVILVADSRVSNMTDGTHFDVCQKVVLLGNDGLFGFAGPIKGAADTAHWITGTYKKLGVAWLTTKSEVMGMLSHIGALGQSEQNSFLVAFMDERSHATLVRFSTNGDYAVTHVGIEMIGTGSETYEAIRPKLTDLMNFGGPGRGGAAAALRALLFSHMIVDEAKARAIGSVGGLMQVHFVERGGTRAIPYERWVDIDESNGTYVKMDIDAEGAWVQLHEPSGLKVPLRFPGESDFGAGSGNLDLERLLTKDSPGVQVRPNPVLMYKPYLADSGECLVRTGDSNSS